MEAGAVLVDKLKMGADWPHAHSGLAGGRQPMRNTAGSSGSSAGSRRRWRRLVGFAWADETNGQHRVAVPPCVRHPGCGRRSGA